MRDTTKITCKNCSYFVQHYGLGNLQFFRLNCGHCTRFRRKAKKPDYAVCEHFAAGETDVNKFVTKEYLSKQLLNYVLHLELLPEIKDMPDG